MLVCSECEPYGDVVADQTCILDQSNSIVRLIVRQRVFPDAAAVKRLRIV